MRLFSGKILKIIIIINSQTYPTRSAFGKTPGNATQTYVTRSVSSVFICQWWTYRFTHQSKVLIFNWGVCESFPACHLLWSGICHLYVKKIIWNWEKILALLYNSEYFVPRLQFCNLINVVLPNRSERKASRHRWEKPSEMYKLKSHQWFKLINVCDTHRLNHSNFPNNVFKFPAIPSTMTLQPPVQLILVSLCVSFEWFYAYNLI